MYNALSRVITGDFYNEPTQTPRSNTHEHTYYAECHTDNVQVVCPRNLTASKIDGNYTVSQKNIPDIYSFHSSKHYLIVIILAKVLLRD